MFSGKIRSIVQRIGLRTRLTGLFILVFGTAFIVYALILHSVFVSALQVDFDDALFNYSVDVGNAVSLNPSENPSKNPLVPILNLEKEKILPFPLGATLIEVRHRSGRVLTRVGNWGDWNPRLTVRATAKGSDKDAFYQTVTDVSLLPEPESDSYRIITVPIDANDPPLFYLRVAAPLSIIDSQAQSHKHLLISGVPIILLLASLLGYFFARGALSPVEDIINQAKAIHPVQLSRRIPLPLAKDEIRDLAETLNDMLERIETAFLSQERFVADASHQLLTPLALLKSEIELKGKTSEIPSEIKKTFKSLLEETDRLTRIVKDMLLLARVDAGTASPDRREVRFDELVLEVLGRIDVLAKSREISIHFNLSGNPETPPSVIGDPDLLEHLVFNLIDNAVKYSPKGEAVRVELLWNESDVTLSVDDNGPGIPSSQTEAVYARFRRASDADTRAKGFGLGLAIAQKVAQLHHGAIWHEPKQPHGTTFFFRIKRN